MRRGRVPLAVVAGVLAAVVLSGCSENVPTPSTGTAVAGVTEYSPATSVVHFSGKTITGRTFDSSAYRGKVLVVNFWYAGCGPCRAEAPEMVAVAKQFAGQGVQFIGVNVRDQAGQAAPFQTTFGVPYPSILDVDGGAVQLAFSATNAVKPNAIPTTVVLNAQGRITATVLGELQSTSILSSLIDTAKTGKRTT